MKKIFIAILVSAALAFCVGSVQAGVPGARDIAPGSEFVTYFLVSKARVDTGAGPSTLLSISETKGKVTVGDVISWSKLHFNFYTINTVWVHDLKISITRWATLLKDIGAMIQDMSNDERAKLAVTFGGADYYAGYIVVSEITYANADNIIADVLQLDLSSGQAAIANIPVKQYAYGLSSQLNTDNDISYYGAVARNYEVWTGDALACAGSLVRGGAAADATWFAMYPKYLINDASGKTYWIIWRSSIRTSTGALVAEVRFHTWVINGAEDYRSTTIDIRELSILDAGAIIPSVLKVAYPYIGQINLTIPGDTDPGTGLRIPSAAYLQMQMLGWNWRLASSAAASLNWAGMSLMAADAGTTPSVPYYPAY